MAERNTNIGESAFGIQRVASDGRSDSVPAVAPVGAFVIPADVVSRYGRGSSTAGARGLDELFGAQALRDGGAVGAFGPLAPVDLSEDEYLVMPHQVSAFGEGDHAAGTQALLDFLAHVRR